MNENIESSGYGNLGKDCNKEEEENIKTWERRGKN